MTNSVHSSHIHIWSEQTDGIVVLLIGFHTLEPTPSALHPHHFVPLRSIPVTVTIGEKVRTHKVNA